MEPLSKIISLADRARPLKKSNIRTISQAVDEVGGINLGQGICDLPTPDAIKERTHAAIDADQSIYSHHAGIEALREGILAKAQEYNDLPATSIDEVVVSAGSTGAFVTAVMTLLQEGDEVILFEPFYGYHRNILKLTGATVRYVPLGGPEDTFDPEVLKAAVTDRTRAVIVNTPANPSGKVWSRDELASLLAVMQEHDIVAITDEIYEYMTYDDADHVSLGSLPGAYERTITLSGFSKTYNVTGWRLGYAVGPDRLLEKMGLMNDLFYVCAPRPLQHGMLAVFEDLGDDYYAELLDGYYKRRALMCETLEAIGFDVPRPKGAYYAFADFGPIRDRPGFSNDVEAADTLIREAGVGSVTGRSFFHDPSDGVTKLRFCFGKELSVLKQACDQLLAAFG
ncbi:aspartate aminotransferase [Longibacter salinarum]|uniref:Aminotransferase n=1 Tax=Longibacter salinarum TaxID=1850348 RepID=A0A2A8CY41_9BACT|nr:pyridoxal phosphate-dependent aminotransferase [Longibacter salinarum]PEN13632.1 aspartate aminotransferase [Longibacter salinarum]